MVSGGDALIEIKGAAAGLHVTLNGRDVTAKFHADAARESMVGLVDGLTVGKNTLAATAASGPSGKTTLELINHPITGPILSGDHLKPYVCMTAESGLGAPLDDDCSAATKGGVFLQVDRRRFQAASRLHRHGSLAAG
jgi:hypothetical protein